MTEYHIAMSELPFAQPHEDISPIYSFRISRNDQIAAASICASGSVMSLGALKEHVDWPQLLSIVLLQQSESCLRAGLSMTSVGLKRFTCDVDAAETLVNIARGPKHCKWQRPDDSRGKFCLATQSGQPEPTTKALCASCEIPDARLVCSALVHPITRYEHGISVASADSSSPLGRRRIVAEAYCEELPEPQKWSACLPWSGKECWHRIVNVAPHIPVPDKQAPRRIIDEIGYLRLVYAHRFELTPSQFKKLWPARDESAVAALLDDCESRAQFERQVVILDDVLGCLRPHDQLEEGKRKDDKGDRVNGITALGRVFDDCIDGANSSYVAPLQALKTTRNSFAHERKKELVEALSALGVSHYGAGSWQLAWWQVTASVAEALAPIPIT